MLAQLLSTNLLDMKEDPHSEDRQLASYPRRSRLRYGWARKEAGVRVDSNSSGDG